MIFNESYLFQNQNYTHNDEDGVCAIRNIICNKSQRNIDAYSDILRCSFKSIAVNKEEKQPKKVCTNKPHCTQGSRKPINQPQLDAIYAIYAVYIIATLRKPRKSMQS